MSVVSNNQHLIDVLVNIPDGENNVTINSEERIRLIELLSKDDGHFIQIARHNHENMALCGRCGGKLGRIDFSKKYCKHCGAKLIWIR